MREHAWICLFAGCLFVACDSQPGASGLLAGSPRDKQCVVAPHRGDQPADNAMPDEPFAEDQPPEQGSTQDGAALVGGDGVELPFRIVDAEYSGALDRIVIVTAEPNRLIVLDPESLEYNALTLPLAPSSVSVHPDGRSSAVGHDGSASVIRLDPLELMQRLPVSGNVRDVILAANGYLYASPPLFSGGKLASIELATGAETSMFTGTSSLLLHPAGDRLYGVEDRSMPGSLVRYDITSGVAKLAYEWPYFGDFPVCYNLALTQDGARILSACGQAFSASDVRMDDMKYIGTLEGNVSWQRIDHSNAAHLIAVIHSGNSVHDTRAATEFHDHLALFEDAYLSYRQTLALPEFADCGTRYAAEPRFAFFSANGTRLYALVAAEPEAHADAYGLVRYSVDELEPDPPATLPVAKAAQGAVLDFAILDAEYSRALDRVIGVQGNPSRLLVIDPTSASFETVELPLSPTAVSLLGNGKRAAIGHNGWISLVDLELKTVVSTQPIATDVFDIELADNGYAYAFPRRDQWVNIFSMQLSSGIVTLSGRPIDDSTVARLHPSGDRLYGANSLVAPSNIERYDISGGTAQVSRGSPYHGEHEMCGNLWFSDDGSRIFTACGDVFRASNEAREDMTYVASLAGLTRFGLLASVASIASLDHSTAAGLVAAGMIKTKTDAHGRLLLFDAESLQAAGRIETPDIMIGGKTYVSAPRFVFFDAGGTEIHVLAEPDLPEGMAPRTLLMSVSASAR